MLFNHLPFGTATIITSVIRYGSAIKSGEGIACKKGSVSAANCARQNAITLTSTSGRRFLPTKIQASAIQPRPLAMFGTKDEMRRASIAPDAAAVAAAMHHAIVLLYDTFTPRDLSTSSSLPVILM